MPFYNTRHCKSTTKGITLSRNPRKSGKSGKFSEKTRRSKFPEISGNYFSGISGIWEISRQISGNLGFFPETALRSRVHAGKIGVKSIEIQVFFEKSLPEIPGKSPGKSPENRRKKSAFFSCFSRLHAKIQLISGKSSRENFPGNSPFSGKIFPGKFSEIPKFRKFPEKKPPKMTVFGKISPLLRSVFYRAHF